MLLNVVSYQGLQYLLDRNGRSSETRIRFHPEVETCDTSKHIIDHLYFVVSNWMENEIIFKNKSGNREV